MRLLKSVFITVFKGEVPSHRFSRSLPLEVLLSDSVEVGGGGQPSAGCCCLLSRLFPDEIGGALFTRSAVLRAMRVERGHAADDECCHSHHYEEPHRFELSGHVLTNQPHAILFGKHCRHLPLYRLMV